MCDTPLWYAGSLPVVLGNLDALVELNLCLNRLTGECLSKVTSMGFLWKCSICTSSAWKCGGDDCNLSHMCMLKMPLCVASEIEIPGARVQTLFSND